MIKFIVIDDEAYVVKLFPRLLNWQEYGFELAGVFTSAKDALVWLETNSCDVIFSDISMPDMLGTQLAKICSEAYPNIFIVLFSAYRDFNYALDAIKYNVFDYIVKPFSRITLTETITNLSKKINAQKGYSAVEASDADDTDNIISRAMHFIMEHYHEEISVNDVARHVNISNNYFSTIFKKKTNESFIATLKKIRLKKAKELLRDRNVKISSIPNQIGFKSYSYFTKVFQQEFGETPTDYRNKYFSAGVVKNNENTL